MGKYIDAVRSQALTVGERRYTYGIGEGRGGWLVLD